LGNLERGEKMKGLKEVAVQIFRCEQCKTRIVTYRAGKHTSLVCVNCGLWMDLISEKNLRVKLRNIEEDQDFYDTAFYPDDDAVKILCEKETEIER